MGGAFGRGSMRAKMSRKRQRGGRVRPSCSGPSLSRKLTLPSLISSSLYAAWKHLDGFEPLATLGGLILMYPKI